MLMARERNEKSKQKLKVRSNVKSKVKSAVEVEGAKDCSNGIGGKPKDCSIALFLVIF